MASNRCSDSLWETAMSSGAAGVAMLVPRLLAPTLGEHATDHKLERMINHDRQQNQADSRVGAEDKPGHGHSRSEGFFGSAKHRRDPIFSGETECPGGQPHRRHDERE